MWEVDQENILFENHWEKNNEPLVMWDIEGVNKSLLDLLHIEWITHRIKEKSDSKKEGQKLWLEIKSPIPIYFFEWTWWLRQWCYVKKLNMIFMFDNADDITLKHEIIHSLEINKDIPGELCEFYEKVKSTITEDSFVDSFVSFNFCKDIHEFIADGYSKQPFINALKKENLYDEFIEKTKYIFE